MKIGIVPCLDKNAGGVFQYSQCMMNGLKEISGRDRSDTFFIIADDIFHPALKKYKGFLKIIPLNKADFFKRNLKKIITEVPLSSSLSKFISRSVRIGPQVNESSFIDGTGTNYSFKKWISENRIDFLIYPTSNALSYQSLVPYIFTVHDLQHRVHPEFPEIFENNGLIERENIMKNGISNALMVIAESKVGKEDIIKYYGKYIQENNIEVLLYLSQFSWLEPQIHKNFASLRKKYKIPKKFLFYPAQFWPHKNHLRIIKALIHLKGQNKLDIPLVLSGGYTGTIKESVYLDIMLEAKKGKVENNIIVLGYMPDSDLPTMYSNARALIMPTFFGPSNIPFIEAWQFGCPVVTSDIPGIKEQVEGAAVVVNPESVTSIANAIKSIWENDRLHDQLAHAGYKKFASYSKEDYNKRLIEIISAAKKRFKYGQKNNK